MSAMRCAELHAARPRHELAALVQWIAKLSSCATTSPTSRISTMRLNSERGSQRISCSTSTGTDST